MKIVITIFALPHEIDDLEQVVFQLKRASHLLSSHNTWAVDITVATSDYLVDWRRSSMPKSYFFEKLNRFHQLSDWCDCHFQLSDTMKGSLAQKHFSYNKHADADIYIWLDPDIIFGESTLALIESCITRMERDSLFILSPEIVKMWDSTWDCLVCDRFLDKPFDYQQHNNPFEDSGVKGEITLQEVKNTSPKQPRFKVGSGFFTTLPRNLFDYIPFPQSFGHYGLEDTFIMWAAEKLVASGKEEIKQFKIKNLVVCENYKYRFASQYTSHLSLHNRKEELKAISQRNFQTELAKIG